ncbi:hypothetical protein NDU88_002895 [Pleurodeles waltl]|uniref:Uncharacterized protein n=1 Tax=Pleurodeles waltl TaxID=8319 RepID=A0AAV7L4P9_PLEWA|nr:hypothetical protein NDU88_002895 [Pleurodeles waltl]
MQRRFGWHEAERQWGHTAVSGPHYRVVEVKRGLMRSRSPGSSRRKVWQSHDAAGQHQGVVMTSQGHRLCDGIGSSRTLDLRHAGVSEVGWDEWLQTLEAYRVAGHL